MATSPATLFRHPSHLLAMQSSVATRSQLRAVGFSDDFIRAQVDARRWQVLNDAVVVCHNGPLTHEQQIWAVWLSTSPPAAMCGLTALQLWGMARVESSLIHVVVPKGGRPLPTRGIPRHVHESRRFTVADIAPAGRPVPVTRPARSAIDAAVWTRDPQAALRIVLNAVQQRICDPTDMLIELGEADRVRHRALLARALDDVAGGVEAVSELSFLRFCRKHGLPEPELQVRLDSRGRRRYLDATFRRRPDGRAVRIEIDGGVHLTLTQRWRDTRNDNDAVIDGEIVLRFPSVAIHTDDPVALQQIHRALGLVRR
jgi:hypothetical protein